MSFPHHRLIPLALLAAAALGASVVAVDAGATRASFPGKNGRIVFNDQTGALVLVNPDGTRRRPPRADTARPTTRSGHRSRRDGTQIAYSTNRAERRRRLRDPRRTAAASARSRSRAATTSTRPVGRRLADRLRDATATATSTSTRSTLTGPTAAAHGSPPSHERDPAWSPAGDRIAYTVESAAVARQIWVMNGDGSGKQQLTTRRTCSENPNWSPDGRWIVFDSDRAEKGDLDDLHDAGRRHRRRAADRQPGARRAARVLARREADRLRQRPRPEGQPQALRDAGRRRRCARVIGTPGYTYQMVPDWQPLQRKDPCTIRGTINADVLTGTARADVICGLGGEDIIERPRRQRHAARRRRNDQLNGGTGTGRPDRRSRQRLAQHQGRRCRRRQRRAWRRPRTHRPRRGQLTSVEKYNKK